MKNLFFAGLVVIGLSVVACDGKAKSDATQAVIIEPLATATTTVEPTPTVVKPSLPCYTKSTDQRSAIIAELQKTGGKVEKETFSLEIDGDCIRGHYDWSPANSFVEAHPDAVPETISPTPFQQLADWEKEIGLPSSSVDSNVYWVSGTSPSKAVCDILSPTLRCYD